MLGLKATLIPAFTATGIALLDILDFNNAHVLDEAKLHSKYDLFGFNVHIWWLLIWKPNSETFPFDFQPFVDQTLIRSSILFFSSQTNYALNYVHKLVS